MLAGAVSLLLVAATLPAQDFTWGPELGLNMTTLGGDDATDAKSKLGFHAGVAVKHQKAGKKMFVQTGVAFSQRGSDFDILGSTGTLAVNYIEIPAMAGWTFPSSNAASKVTPHLQAGANIGILMSCDAEFGGSSADCKDDTKSLDVGVGGGGGVTLNNNMGDWQITVLYLLGLSTIDNPPSGTAGDIKNRGFTVKVVWFMKKKGAM